MEGGLEGGREGGWDGGRERMKSYTDASRIHFIAVQVKQEHDGQVRESAPPPHRTVLPRLRALTLGSIWSRLYASSASICTELSALMVTDPLLAAGRNGGSF